MRTKSHGLGKLLLKRFSSRRKPRAHPSSPAKFKKKATAGPLGRILALSIPEPISAPAPAPIATPLAPARIEQVKKPGLAVQRMIRPDEAFKQSIEAFLLDQRSEHTRRAYGRDLKRFVQYLLAQRFVHPDRRGLDSLDSVDRALIVGYKDALLSEGLEHTTVDRHLATLRSFFRWLVDDGLLFESPAERVRFLNPKRLSKTIGFSDEEVRKLLAQPDLHRRTGALHYAILMTLFYCGLRRSELCSIQMSQIGVERSRDEQGQQKEHRVLRLRGKGNSERLVVLVPAVWNALVYYLRITGRQFGARDEFLFQPVRNNRTGQLFKAVDPSMIYYIVAKYAKLAGIENRVSPHSCRATAISNARDHHVPDRAIQEFAGWTSPAMITRYDKRKSALSDSAAHAIQYGDDPRLTPLMPEAGFEDKK